jgi:hypothetical protein
MDLLYGHENSGYVLVTLQQKEGIGSEQGQKMTDGGITVPRKSPAMD